MSVEGLTGIVSLGLFHKSIDGYIVQTVRTNDPAYGGFALTFGLVLGKGGQPKAGVA